MFNATMKFDLGEDVNALRETVHRWAQERVKPMATEIDRSNAFPPNLWTEMGNLGLWVSLWAKNLAVLACLIWRILLRLKRLRVPLPLFLCLTGRIRTCV